LATLTAGAGTTVLIVAVDGLLGGATSPLASVPVAVAVSLTEPASTSATVTA
jgi:hypothetical protein